jgi:serine/threonine-protein kinase
MAKQCPTCGGRYPADFRVCPRDAAPLEDSPEEDDPMLGMVLADSYEVIRSIGEGGMGRVYEARHQRLRGKRFAVKVLHHELARQADVVTRFQREAEAASALEHPNVVGVFDVNRTPDGRPYIVAELLEGEQLGDYLDRAKKISAAEAAQLLRPVCRALALAHQRGIVHRDVKPENVFLSGKAPNFVAKILDFGISKVGETKGTLTKTGMVMGSPGYIAPEQARGDKVDARADIYALGAILYRAVTGHKPFGDLDPIAAITAVLVQEPQRPRSAEPSIPPAFELVIQRAMAMDPKERFQSMAELEAALLPFEPIVVVPADASGAGVEGTALSPDASSEERAAKTMVVRERTPRASDTLAGITRNVRLARPTILAFTVVGFVWLIGGLVDAVTGCIRLLGGDSTSLSTSNVTLAIVGVVAAMLTPAFLWMRHLASKVWRSTPRSISVAVRLRRTVLISTAVYGIAWLSIHLFQGVVQRRPLGVAWPGWEVAVFLLALCVGALVWLSGWFASDA